MIRWFLALAGALLLAACGSPDQVPREDGTPPSPALWEVTSPDGAKGWLFGTIHALPEGTSWRTPAFDAAFAEADALVLEIANLADRKAINDTFMQLAVTPGMVPVTERVPIDRAEAVEDVLEEAGYTDGGTTSLETWAVAMSISTNTGESGEGIDSQLLELNGQRPVLGMENAADQLGAFDRLSEKEQVRLLLSVVDETGTPEKRKARAAAWRAGDLELLERETHEGMLADKGLRDALLVGRNRAWLARIEQFLQDNRRPFMAVGAGHVVGADGLPALLEELGYTVRRLQ